MRQMVLTGLGSEQRFNHESLAPAGAAEYFLIFNDGELRVPVSEEAAKIVVQAMYGSNGESPPVFDPPTPTSSNGESDFVEDDGVPSV